MNQQQLDEIKARAEKATPGPWRAGDCKPYSPNQKSPFDDYGAEITAPQQDKDKSPEYPTIVVEGGAQDEQGGAVGVLLPQDADFIARARQDIPALIAEVERLRQEIDQAEKKALDYYVSREELRDEVERLTRAMSLSGVADTMAKYATEIERLQAENEQLKQDINRMVY